MRKHNPASLDSGSFVPGRRHNGLHGKDGGLGRTQL